jgi:hypothetical protein
MLVEIDQLDAIFDRDAELACSFTGLNSLMYKQMQDMGNPVSRPVTAANYRHSLNTLQFNLTPEPYVDSTYQGRLLHICQMTNGFHGSTTLSLSSTRIFPCVLFIQKLQRVILCGSG